MMMKNFQYWIHNPDFPSIIKDYLFTLDYDVFVEGLLEKDDLLDKIVDFDNKITELFNLSIKK